MRWEVMIDGFYADGMPLVLQHIEAVTKTEAEVKAAQRWWQELAATPCLTLEARACRCEACVDVFDSFTAPARR